MKRCLPDETQGLFHGHQLGPSSSEGDDGNGPGPRKRFLVGDSDDDNLQPLGDEEGTNLDYIFNDDDNEAPEDEPSFHYSCDDEAHPEEHVPDARFPGPWPPLHDPQEIILEDDDDVPPPGTPLVSAEDMKLLWTSIGQTRDPDALIRCMLCRSQGKRCYWTTHMKRQHGAALGICTYGYCGWKCASGKPLDGCRHMLACHDTLSWHCKACPGLIFDSRIALCRHECQVHINWPPSAFVLDMGEDPLHEDDQGGTLLENTADTEGDDFRWESSIYHWSFLLPARGGGIGRGGGGGGARSARKPKSGRVGGSKLGHCMVGGVPW